jgi:hypothetical protein
VQRKRLFIYSSIVALFLMIILVAFFAFASPFSQPSPLVPSSSPILSIDPQTLHLSSTSIGQTINVDIRIDNVTNLWAWTVENLTFNPNVLSLMDMKEGTFLKNSGPTLFLWPYTYTPDIVRGLIDNIHCTLLQSTSVTGGGVLATISFKVISAGNSQITIGNSSLLDPYSYDYGVHKMITGAIVNNGNVIVDSPAT